MSPITELIGGAKAYGWGNFLSVSGTFESIATATGNGSSAFVDLTSIPSTYQHLQLRISGEPNNPGGGGATNVVLRMNLDSGSNYTVHYITGNGTGASADGGASQTSIVLGNILQGSGSSIVNGLIVDILDYANTSKTKVVKSIGGVDKNGDGWTGIWAGSWQSTSAITSLRVYANDGLNLPWSTNSKISLYGIKAAA